MKLLSERHGGELRLMVQCLELYYKQGRSQKDIAVALGVSAATVSRLLKRAMDDGLVRVELDLPRTEELETALVQTYGLREAVVVASGGRGDLRAELGAAAADYFEKVAENGMRIGLSCGFTLYHTIHSLRGARFCALAESYGVSVKRLRQLGVVGEINYQPFDAEGHVVDRRELRALSHRLLSVEGERLQALSRRDDHSVIAVAGGKTKVDALRGALAGRFLNVLVTDEDAAIALLRR